MQVKEERRETERQIKPDNDKFQVQIKKVSLKRVLKQTPVL